MKSLIPLIFAILALSCDEVIEYRDRIVYEKIPYKVATFSGYSLDTVIARKVKPRTIYRDTIIYVRDTVYIDSIVYIEKIVEVPVIVYDTIETVRVDTVERQAELVYDPIFQNYVDSFFVYAEMVPETGGMLAVDITMIAQEPDLVWYGVSSTEIVDGGYLIKINTTENCYEAGVYRELLRALYQREYVNASWHPMQRNWGGCFEGLNSEGRRLSLITMFIE